MTNHVSDRLQNIEAEAILPGAPWLVAHKSMLAVNRPNKLTLNNRDYVIWQDGGETFALNNICPHMQAPLSDGRICNGGKAIACPFHGLQFDAEGKLARGKKLQGKTLIEPLELIIKDDLVWTYGNYEPRLSIPDSLPCMANGSQFLGVAGEKTIPAPFLDCLKINYDFNHAIATHDRPFKFEKIITSNYQESGYRSSLNQKIIRANNTLKELITNPALLTVGKVLHNHFEYFFPTITCVTADTFLGKLTQLFVLYPQGDCQTKTFVLLYLKPKNIWTRSLSLLAKASFIKSFDLVIKQDSKILASLYPQQLPKIRLPREEIMFDAEKLYREWG